MMILGIDCSRYAAEKPTGVEIYTDRVVDGIVARADLLGYREVRLYVRSAPQVEQLLYKIEKSGQKTVKVKLIERKNLWTLFWLSLEMIRFPIDVLFVPSHTLPLWVPIRSVMTVHALESFVSPQSYSFSQRFHHWFSLWWAKKSGTQCIAVSQTTKDDLMKFFHVDEKRIQLIHNGFDAHDPKALKDPKMFIEGDYILHIGRLEDRKNQCRLIEAFEKIAGEFKDIKLVLVGSDGYGAEKIHQKASASLVKDRIVITGYLHRDVSQQVLLNAKIFAFPSLAEGFGIPILEAFDAGVPVVTSKGGATEEVGAEAAVYVDPLSVESIAQGLKSLLTDKSLVKKNIEAGKKRIELFSWEHCVEGTVAVLKSFFVEKTSV